MTFQHFASFAAAATNMYQLEKLFVDELKFLVDDVPSWRVNNVWTENKTRIEGNGETGECLDDCPLV